jgi:malate dehydrogenase
MATFTVAVLGAGGGIGQPLSLLLRLNPLVKDLRLYDVVKHTPGIAKDLEHICASGKVNGFWDAVSSKSKPQLLQALKGVDLVLIPAGVPRKPGMSRDDLFGVNAGIIAGLCKGIAAACPQAMVAIICNPVNSTVPIAAEVFKSQGCYNPKKICGVTQLDLTRSKSFWAEHVGQKPEHVSVPVIGGHSGVTIVPLLSQATPRSHNKKRLKEIAKRVQSAGSEVVKLKAGAGSATLSMAYSAAEFATLCLKGLGGSHQDAYAYVASNVHPSLSYFASRVTIGPTGIEKVHGIGEISPEERELLNAAVEPLKTSIDKGIDFVRSKM